MLEQIFREPKFRVCCLGAIKLVESGSNTDMTPTRRKTRALIGYLCIVRKPVARERLASLLWGDRGDEQARASLRQAIYELRSILGGDRLLKVERDTVAAGDDVVTDVAAILAAAQSGNLDQLGQALAEWRGEFCEDLPAIDPSFDAWLQSERHRVQESLVEAATEAAKAGLAKGEIDPARKVVGLLQQRDGTNEVVLRLGLRLDHLAGDSAALRRRYERFRELLKSELDAVPAAETRILFDELTMACPAPAMAVQGDAADAANKYAEQSSESGVAIPVVPLLAQPVTGLSAHIPSPIRSGGGFGTAAVALGVAFLCALAILVWSLANSGAPVPGDERNMSSSAHDHYLKGRSLLFGNDPRAAAAELETSIRLAPNSADAWAVLAAARLFLAGDTFMEHGKADDLARSARTAAERALSLDPNNGEALGVLAMLVPSNRLGEIDRQLEHAMRSAPNNAQLLAWRGEFLMFVGRNHEALDALTRAFVLDRATPFVAPNLVLASLKSGRNDRAREVLDLMGRGRDENFRSELLHLHIKYFLYQTDWFGLATWLGTMPAYPSPPVAAFLHLCRETAVALATRDAEKFGGLRAGWRSESSAYPDDAVQFLAALGDADGALEAVQSAVRSRRNDGFLTDPEWEALFVPSLVPLRRDPRIPVLLAQWGLSDYWRTSDHSPDFMR